MAVEKISANRGDLFEAFFAAAVAARFVKRAKTKSAKKLPLISVNDVDQILAEMMKNGYIKNVNDVGSAVVDTVTVNVSIPKKASDFLQTRSNWAKVSDLRNGAINFANSHSRLNAQARGLSINEQIDFIKVTAAGTEDQRGTKADVKVEVTSPQNPDRRFRNIDYSLKVSGGEQFHQVSGQGFDKFLSIFGEMGIDVSPVAAKYNDAINDFFDTEIYTKKYTSRASAEATGGGPKLKSSAQIVYNHAAKEMTKILEDSEPNLSKQKFADYIIFGLSRNVNTELVKFVGKGNIKTRVANREFRDILANSIYSVSVNQTGDPKIIVSLGSAKLLQIRYKLEVASGTSAGQKVYRFYPRHYLEALEGMFSI
tara:strand:+ start:51 stop:1157 length:1107 start_codon:yes stop_codon:yes gene_type:complete